MDLLAGLLADTGMQSSAATPGGGLVGNGYVIPNSSPKALFSNATFKAQMLALVSANATSYQRVKAVVDSRSGIAGATLISGYYSGLLYQLLVGTNPTLADTYATYAHDETMAFVASEEALISSYVAGTNSNTTEPTTIAFNSFLYVGEILVELLLNYDWCRHKFTQGEKDRLFAYANQVLYNIKNPTLAAWGGKACAWSGWAVNVPSNNYFNSHFQAYAIVALCSFGDNPQAQAWWDYLTGFVIPLVINDLAILLPNGGSLEGTNYGMTLRLYFFMFHLISVSTGLKVQDMSGYTQGTMYWISHCTSPDCLYMLSVGDQSRVASAPFFDYSREMFMQILAMYPGDPCARAFKQRLINANFTQMVYSHQYYADMFYDNSAIQSLPPSSLPTNWYDSGTGIFSFRANWNVTGTWVTQQVGVVFESHQHFTNGAIAIFKKDWLFDTQSRRSPNGLLAFTSSDNIVRFDTAAGLNAYNFPANTISQNWTLRTNVNGYPDNYSYPYAYYNDANIGYVESNTKPAYYDKPEVVTVRRGMLVLKNPASDNMVTVVFDQAVSATAATIKAFQLNTGWTTSINGNKFSFNTGAVQVDVYAVDANGGAWTDVTIPVSALMVTASHRLERSISGNVQANFLHVIDVDAEIQTVTSNNTGTTSGVNIVYKDGRTANIVFNNSTNGGTLLYKNAANAVLYTGALPTTVNTYSNVS